MSIPESLRHFLAIPSQRPKPEPTPPTECVEDCPMPTPDPPCRMCEENEARTVYDLNAVRAALRQEVRTLTVKSAARTWTNGDVAAWFSELEDQRARGTWSA